MASTRLPASERWPPDDERATELKGDANNPSGWLMRGLRVWLDQTQYIVGDRDDRGLVLEQRRRGLGPVRRLLNPAELAIALESGRLRPARNSHEKEPNP